MAAAEITIERAVINDLADSLVGARQALRVIAEHQTSSDGNVGYALRFIADGVERVEDTLLGFLDDLT